MRKKLLTGLLVLALAAGMSSVAAQPTSDASKDTNVSVTIASQTAVDLYPTDLAFSGAQVGSQNTTSDNSYGSLELENVGSNAIDKVWLNSSYPSPAPFGTGSVSNHNTGNFVQVKPNSNSGDLAGDSSNYHYVQRIEYTTNDSTEYPSYIQASGTYNGVTATEVYVGRFRLGSQEYFYTIPTGSTGVCDGTGSSFDDSGTKQIIRVATKPHNSTQIGTTDFTGSSGNYKDINISQTSTNYGVTENGVHGTGVQLNATSEKRDYDILTKCSQAGNSHTIRSRYNVETGGVNMGSNGNRFQYIHPAGSTLQPGESETIDVAVEIPRGVPSGTPDFGTLTAFVTAN